jgi:hypothetical protein
MRGLAKLLVLDETFLEHVQEAIALQQAPAVSRR